MPSIPEELNVFRRPHGHMLKLVEDIERELSATNFADSQSYLQLMNHLSTNFHAFQCHEEIENRYIVRELMPRLPCRHKARLKNDLHSDNRLSTIVKLLGEGLKMECSSKGERKDFGERLKTAISSFTVAFLPHMREEEEVFLPLLVEYFSEPELKQLTKDIIELHHLDSEEGLPLAPPSSPACPIEPSQHTPSLLHMPPGVLLTIFSHLAPTDLLRVSQTHSSLHQTAFDPTLWRHLHPVRWACGHVKFFMPPTFALMALDNSQSEEGVMTQDAVIENDFVKELMSVEGQVNANLRGKNMSRCFLVGQEDDEGMRYMEREARVLSGVVDHILPRVGKHVQTLDLAHGKAVSNAIVFRMLRHCPNLTYLDLSYTGISDFAFQGLLSSNHNHWKLCHVDLTGCPCITDTSLQRLAQAITPPSLPCTTRRCCGGGEGGCGKEKRGSKEGGGKDGKEAMLQSLILSGCHQVTDVGLRTLAMGCGLPHLQYLNLSGLPNITKCGLSDLTSTCPSLQPELLFYCDNIAEGPYATCASGCLNIGLSRLACCRSSVDSSLL